MVLAILFISLSQALHLNCWSNECYNCTEGKLNFEKTNCLDICPTGYTKSDILKNCNDTKIQKNLFEVDFKSNLNYYSSSIGDFTHPYKFPFKYDRNGPIPTKDRGFYFSNTSRLTTSKQPILAPSFICGLVLKVLYPGNIFSVKQGSLEKLLIHTNETNIKVSMHVCASNVCSIFEITDLHNSTWITFYFY